MSRYSAAARKELVKERRQQILEAAARVFSEKGFDRATIRDVAQAAGVAEGSIYRYFKNKQDLLVHLPRLFAEPQLEAIQSASTIASTEALDPKALLDLVAHKMIQVLQHNQEIVRVLMTTLPLMDDTLRAEYIHDLPEYAFGVLEAFIRSEQAAGVMRADLDPVITARLFPGSLFFFFMVQEIIQPRDMPRLDYDRVIEQMVKIYTHGILAAPKPDGETK